MNTDQLIQVVNGAVGGINTLISQVAWFIAIGNAASLFSVSVPLMMLTRLFSSIHDKHIKDNTQGYTGYCKVMAGVLFAISMGYGVKGLSHLVQAGIAPAIYTASTSDALPKAVSSMLGNKK
jgi:hypothetical protein